RAGSARPLEEGWGIMFLLANVSFGIIAITPIGWVFMALIILLECAILSRRLAAVWWDSKVARATTVANLVSGVVGFYLSLQHNSGWWVVVWLPWVSRNEVGIPSQLKKFVVYYLVAFLLSILIEGVVEQIMLRSRYSGWKVWKASLLANFVSYLLASV